MKNKIFLALALGFSAAPSFANPHITNATYDPNTVYSVFSTVGKVALLQLEDDERLTSESAALGIGDVAGWSLGVRGNNVMLKPVGIKPNTNIVIVTNKRSYAFELKAATKDHPATYIIRFTFPDTEAKKAALAEKEINEKIAFAAAAAKRQTEKKALIASSTKNRPVLNTKYSWAGQNPALKPTAAWDDGRFTHLTYDNAAALPNFYKVLSDGTEGLLNTNVDPEQKNTIILQEVIKTVRVRLGKDVIEITNDAYVTPKFNATGTGDFDSVRVDKGAF
jgi:type IV secretion system protein VirB9